MQARFYVPWYHKFAAPDPALDQQFEDTQSWNIYSYCQNNPVTNVDPDGEKLVDFLYGAAYAASSNLSMGTASIVSRLAGFKIENQSSDFHRGAAAISAGMAVVSGGVAKAGAATTLGLTTSGGGAPGAVITAAASISAVGVAAVSTANVAIHTALLSKSGSDQSGSSQGTRESEQGDDLNAGGLKAVKDNQLKRDGIDAHKMKDDLVGKAGGKYNISVDKSSESVYLTPVKKGAGEPIKTSYKYKELAELYPRSR